MMTGMTEDGGCDDDRDDDDTQGCNPGMHPKNAIRLSTRWGGDKAGGLKNPYLVAGGSSFRVSISVSVLLYIAMRVVYILLC